MQPNSTTKHGKKPIDIAGQRFGRLVALEVAPTPEHRKNHAVFWRCICDCGNEKLAHGVELRNGRCQSCGCLQEASRHSHTRTHGMTKTPEYRAWCAMIKRCYSPNYPERYLYGGRGITVCDHWRYSFESFLADMGKRPSPLHSVDRIDTDGPYSPENCQWATDKEQANNRRNNHVVNLNGETHSVAEWANILGVPYRRIYSRLRKGVSPEKALRK